MQWYVILSIITIAIVAVILLRKSKMVYQEGYCGLKFYMIRDKNIQETANLYCDINKRILTLIKYLKKYHPIDPRTLRLVDEYDENDICESTGQTFTINKGRNIYLCTQDRNGNLYDINTLMFVIIHELTHVSMPEYDNHSRLFWDNNVWMLNNSIRCGIYKKIDYSIYPCEYCGITINKYPI